MKYRDWLFLVILAANTACVHFSGYSETMFFATLTLDHQQNSDDLRGDWAFRRERLRYLSVQLAESNPDILTLQQCLSRSNNPIDDDQKILQRSSLSQHSNSRGVVESYDGTFEQGSFLTFSTLDVISQKQIDFSDQSSLLLTRLSSPGGSIYSYNVVVKSSETLNRIFRIISNDKCSMRHVIMGDFEGLVHARVIYENDFVDTADNFCPHECNTVDQANPILKKFYPDQKASRRSRILVHKDAQVEDAGVHFSKTTQAPFIVQRRGLDELAVGPYWGWFARVRLPRCLD